MPIRPALALGLAGFLTVATFATPSVLQAQDRGDQRVVTESFAERNQLRAEQNVIEDLLQTLVGLVHDVTLGVPDDVATDRLFGLSDRLSRASTAYAAPALQGTGTGVHMRADDLEQLRILLTDLVDQTVDVRQALRVEGHTESAEKMRDIENGLLDAIAITKKLETDDAQMQGDRLEPAHDEYRRADDDRMDENADSEELDARSEWLAWARERRRDRADRTPRNWDDDEPKERREHSDDWAREEEDRDHGDDNYEERERWRWESDWEWDRDSDPESLIGVHVGEFGYGWPFRETGAYRSIPAIRYNRVEGLVLGLRRLPLSWDSYDRAKVYGHGGYAFGSKEWQYEIGAEARVGSYRRSKDVDVKFGGSYRKTTATQDIWKSSWVENSLAAFFFNYDFLDYFEVQGWTAYAALQLTPLIQITGAYRQEEYSSLRNEVTWSLFGGRDFRFNPPITSGDMNSVLVVVEGGTVADLDWLPRGFAFRMEGEYGRDFGGDFDFNRYLGDARLYIPLNYQSTLSLRVRGGTSSGELPFQKAFTIGGIGSTRSYAQNSLVGTRMLLGNVEYTINQDWFWDDITFSGLFDAGWVNNTGTDKFDFDDVYPSIGAGLGLIDRSVRLELSWPLRDIGGKREPSIWLRINPAF